MDSPGFTGRIWPHLAGIELHPSHHREVGVRHVPHNEGFLFLTPLHFGVFGGNGGLGEDQVAGTGNLVGRNCAAHAIGALLQNGYRAGFAGGNPQL